MLKRLHPPRMKLLLGIIGLLIIIVGFQLQPSTSTAKQEVGTAWETAMNIGQYEYTSMMTQTTWPMPNMYNIGLSSQKDRLFIAGKINRYEETLSFRMWSRGGSTFTGRDGLEIEVKEGQTRGRLMPDGNWEALEETVSTFDPNRDVLAYLVGGVNIENLGLERQAGLSYIRYRFDIDGVAVAEHIRQQMQAHLKRQGQLPHGLNVQPLRQYVDMTGQGELWVSQDGLPLREILHLKFPPHNDMEWVEMDMVADFSGWGQPTQSFFALPHLTLQQRQDVSFLSLTFLGFMMVSLIVIRYRRHRYLYGAVAGATIVSMLTTPLLQAKEIQNFLIDQDIQYRQVEADQAEQRQLNQALAKLNHTDFDPHVDPLTQARQKERFQAGFETPATPLTGVAAEIEALRRGMIQARQQAAEEVEPTADTDEDGLTDQLEILSLNTFPDEADTDNDGIADGIEVMGFRDSSGQQWYLDPLEADSNQDGIIDTFDCPTLANLKFKEKGNLTCPDTDGDGTPDVFDFDNDGDGVPDGQDSDPNMVMAGGLDDQGRLLGLPDQTFSFGLSNYNVGSSLFVDITLRPANAEHLWYSMNVLDWPSNDEIGQIKRVHDTAFGTSGKAANGDMRLMPFLQVKIPNQAQSGLPVKAAFNGTINRHTPLDDWLDQAKLDEFGVSVTKQEDGSLDVNIPMHLMYDAKGEQPIAFTGRMIYRPLNKSFGEQHQMRLVWNLQMQTDTCIPPSDLAGDAKTDYCEDTANWQTSTTIAHTYPDEWFLTGFDVTEERGLDVGLILQKPAEQGRLVELDNELWYLSQDLQATFLDDTASRLSLAELPSALPDPLTMASLSFPDSNGLATLAISHTNRVLAQTYPQAQPEAVANILYAWENRSRAVGLTEAQLNGSAAQGVVTGNQANFNFGADLAVQTIAMIKMSPFIYKGAGVWDAYPLEDYLNHFSEVLKPHLEQLAPQILAADESVTSLTPIEKELAIGGHQYLLKNHYLSLQSAPSATVALDGRPMSSPVGAVSTAVKALADTKEFSLPIAMITVNTVTAVLGGLGFYKSHQSLKAIGPRTQDFNEGAVKTEKGRGLGGLTGAATSTFMILKLCGVIETGADISINALSALDGLLSNLKYTKSNAQWSKGAAAGAAFAVVATITIVALSLTGVIKGTAGVILNLTLKALSTAFTILTIAKQVYTLATTKKATEAAKGLSKGAKTAAVVGLIIAIALAVGIFLFTVISAGIEPGSPAFGELFAQMVAEIIVAVVMFVLALIFPVGTIIVAVIAAIDALIALACGIADAVQKDEPSPPELTEAEKKAGRQSPYAAMALSVKGKDAGETVKNVFCKGITGWLNALVKAMIFSQDPIVDLQAENRMTPKDWDIQFKNQSGFVVSNTITVKANVETGLYNAITGNDIVAKNSQSALGAGGAASGAISGAFLEQQLKRSTFKYRFNLLKDDFHGDLKRSQTEWQAAAGAVNVWQDTGIVAKTEQPISIDYELDRAGLNVPLNIFLQEAYLTPMIQCVLGVCHYDVEDKRTLSNDLRTSLQYDIFPKTVDDFYRLVERGNGSVALAWDEKFPTLADADGDGLRSRAHQGSDPNDGSPDSDGDSISDFHELRNSTDPFQADTDADGLTDYWEAVYNTDPTKQDTDFDGLLDGEEIFHLNPETDSWEGGWLYVYGTDESGLPLTTLVTGNPRKADTDNDGLSDKLEQVYGTNPRVAGDATVLNMEVQLKNERQGGSGQYVRPGDRLNYVAVVENNTRNRNAFGLFEVDFPLTASFETDIPHSYLLAPKEKLEFTGQLDIPTTINQSQTVNFTSRTGADIVNPNEESGGRLVWLRFDKLPSTSSGGMSQFEDSSLLGHQTNCQERSRCARLVTAEDEGYSGRGLTFKLGETNRLEISPKADLAFDALAIGLWLKIDGATSSADLFRRGDDFGLRLQGNQLTGLVKDSRCGTAVTVQSNSLATDSWNHLMLTSSDTSLRLYLNGGLVQETTKSSGLCQASVGQPIIIGGNLDVTLDEVSIYNVARSASEIAAEFREPVVYLKFDTKTATGFRDSSGLRNDSRCGQKLDDNVTLTCPDQPTGVSGKGVSFSQTQLQNLNGQSLQLTQGEFSFASWIYPQPRSTPFDYSSATDLIWKDKANNQQRTKQDLRDVGLKETIIDSYIMPEREVWLERERWLNTGDWQGVWGYEDVTRNVSRYPTVYINEKGQIRLLYSYEAGPGYSAGQCSYTSEEGMFFMQQWQHLALTYDGQLFHLYRNGQEMEASPGVNCQGRPPMRHDQLYLGRPNSRAYLYVDEQEIDDGGDGIGDPEHQIVIQSGSQDSEEQWRRDKGEGTWEVTLGRLLDGDINHYFTLEEIDDGSGDDIQIRADINNGFVRRYAGQWYSADGYGDLYWAVYNDYFAGQLDEFRLYRQSLTADEILSIYLDTVELLDMPLDETPGRSRFADKTNHNHVGLCDGAACPTLGVNRSALFDGQDDQIQIKDFRYELPADGSLTVSAWLKGATQGTILQTDDGRLQFGLDNGRLSFSLNGQSHLSTARVADNQWVYVAASLERRHNTDLVRLFVNDQMTESTQPLAGQRSLLLQSLLVGPKLNGLLREVQITARFLNEAEVRAARQRAPSLYLSFDEGVESDTFSHLYDDYQATCGDADTCPDSGVAGKYGASLRFDGVEQQLSLPNDDRFNLPNFTVGLWLQPEQTKPTEQALLVKGDANGNNSNYALLLDQDNQIRARFNANCSNRQELISEPLVSGSWAHVATSFDGAIMRLFLNGSEVLSKTVSGAACTRSQPVSIGNHESASGFKGQIDELFIYNHALAAEELQYIYDSQIRWYETNVIDTITIDVDDPAIELLLTEDILPNSDIVLAAQASDPTSPLTAMEFRVNGAPWQPITTVNNDIWTFTFTPNGSGAQRLDVRATDAVGRQATVSRTVNLDGQGPTPVLASNLVNQLLPAQRSVHLNGTVNDNLSGVADLYVSLIDHNGFSLTPPQFATLTGNNWQVDYQLPYPPTGQFRVDLRTTDNLNNVTQQAESTVWLNRYAPYADVVFTGSSTQTLTLQNGRPSSLSGTAQNVPYPNGAIFHYHFEEAADSQLVYDASTNLHRANCEGVTCPTLGETGQYGQASRFEGDAALTIIPQLFPPSKLTLAAWLKPAQGEGEIVRLGSLDDAAGYTFFRLANGQVEIGATTAQATAKAATGLPLNQWSHVAGVYNGKQWQIYLNGVLQTAITSTIGPPASTTAWQIGPGYQGLLDELVMYGQALSAENLDLLAKPVNSGLAKVELAFLHARVGNLQTDRAFYLPFEDNAGTQLFTNLDHPFDYVACGAACPQIETSGHSGSAATFNGAQNLIVNAGLSNDTFSLAMWLKTSAANGGLFTVWDETETNYDRSLHLRAGLVCLDLLGFNRLCSSQKYNDNQWHHVVATVKANFMSLYVDGQLVGQAPFRQPLLLDERVVHIGGGNSQWAGYVGQLDELMIFNRALSVLEIEELAKLRWQRVTLRNPDQPLTTWQATVPLGLEGVYNLYLRTTDRFGRVAVLPNKWRGEIDTLSPRAVLDYVKMPGRTYFGCNATDYNLTPDGFVCPQNRPEFVKPQTFMQEAWFIELFETSNKLYQYGTGEKKPSILTDIDPPQPEIYSMTACDTLEQCTTVKAQKIDIQPDFYVTIIEPSPERVYTSPQTVIFSGDARAVNYLQKLEVMVGQTHRIYQTTWSPNSIISDTWRTSWTPPGEGQYQIMATLRNWRNQVITNAAPLFGDTVASLDTTFYVDMTPPTATVTTPRLTTANVDTNGYVTLTGQVFDTVGIEKMQVRIADGEWQYIPVPVAARHEPSAAVPWQATVLAPASINLPYVEEGSTITVNVRAIDIANRVSESSATMVVDRVPPLPFTPTVTLNGAPIEPGTIITATRNPLLTVSWSESNDGSGLQGYTVEWFEHLAEGLTNTLQTNRFLPADNRSDNYQAQEGQKISVRVTATDNYGNQTGETGGPFYLDQAFTPAYVSMDDNGRPYNDWAVNRCHLVGRDNRLARRDTALSAQQFYTTWDHQGLRLAWQGGNWDSDGDLFIYLDTKYGGTDRAYNPYPATISNTVVILPVQGSTQPASTRSTDFNREGNRQERCCGLPDNQMGADMVLWIRDNLTATLLTWVPTSSEFDFGNDGSWELLATQTSGLSQTPFGYHVDTNQPSPLTDFYLPFSLLGLTDPATTELGILAFATEDDALRIWATIPRNNLNSGRVVARTTNSEGQRFMFTQQLQWDGLPDNVCPSGVSPVESPAARARQAGTTPLFSGAEVSVGLAATPNGLTLGLYEDNLVEYMDKLFPRMVNWTALESEYCVSQPTADQCHDRSGSSPRNLSRTKSWPGALAREADDTGFNPYRDLAAIIDTNTEMVGPKQTIDYTLSYVNNGIGPATGLMAQLSTRGPIRLVKGQLAQDDDGQYSSQLIPLGDLAVGEAKEIVVQAVVDFGLRTELRSRGDLELVIYDDTGSVSENQLEWLYAAHRLDNEAPSYVAITTDSPSLRPGPNLIEGVVQDLSPVSNLKIAVEGQGVIDCPHTTPTRSDWQCEVTIAAGSSTVRLRAQAVDQFGLTSDWSAWQTYEVDDTPPDMALSSLSQLYLADGVLGPAETTLDGTVTDNGLLGTVVTCQDDDCNENNLLVDPTTLPDNEYTYTDQPATPLAVGASTQCDTASEVVRTFNVEDEFTVAEVAIGLTVDHRYRADVVAYLYAPNNEWQALVGDGQAAENYDVLLRDTAIEPLQTDLGSHNPVAPYFEAVRQPYAPLAIFKGTPAKGSWRLIVCDSYPQQDDGFYHRSQLRLTSQEVPTQVVGGWQSSLTLPSQADGVEQEVAFYGYDALGNITQTITYTYQADNVPPVLSSTVPLTGHRVSLLGNNTLPFSGTVSDGTFIQLMRILVADPGGATTGDLVPLTADGEWVYTATALFQQEGEHTVWLEAEDAGGNISRLGPYQVTAFYPINYYLPFITNGFDGRLRGSSAGGIYLPLIMR